MPTPKEIDIGFLGTGLMGAPMVGRLCAAGFPVKVWNRTLEKAEALAGIGATVARTLEDAVSGARVVITMLTDGPAVSEVLFGAGVSDTLSTGSTVIDMSSIAPALARDHAAQLAANGLQHLDAPVSGGTRGAADGTLAIMVGGPINVFEEMRPILDVMGRAILVGPSGAGQIAKLANQAIVAVTIGAVAEALAMAAAGGASPAKVKEALSGGFADSAILKQHGQRMLDRNWTPGGRIRMQLKDLRTISAFASELNLVLPLTQRVSDLFEACLAAGFGDHDHSALFLEIERRNAHVFVDNQPGATSPPQA